MGGVIFNLFKAMADIVQEYLLLFLKYSECVSLPLHFAIYNTFYAPLLCKRGMMKRNSSLRNGIPAAPPPPLGHECCWRCSTPHWRKIPSTPILLSIDVLGLLIFHVPQQGDAVEGCTEQSNLYPVTLHGFMVD